MSARAVSPERQGGSIPVSLEKDNSHARHERPGRATCPDRIRPRREMPDRTTSGYLKPGVIDVMAVLPPAPVVGDARYDADRAIFLKTRKLIGSPRWDLATSDVQYGNEAMLHDFSCAAGVTLTLKNASKLTALLDKAGRDTQTQTNIAKDKFQRLRPFLIDVEICQSKDDLAKSYDYPSGHTTGGWTWALVLTDVLPERATAILARGRAYGESRIVCGAHNASAVEAGRLSTTITLAKVRSTAAYKKDVKAARAGITLKLRKSPKAKKPLACDAEAALVSQNVFAPAP